MRLIADWLLPSSEESTGSVRTRQARRIQSRAVKNEKGRPHLLETYVQGELANQASITIEPPSRRYHIYCSASNPGALALMEEVANANQIPIDGGKAPLSKQGTLGRIAAGLKSRRGSADLRRKGATALRVSTHLDDLQRSDRILVHLTARTWYSDEASEALAEEVRKAMDLEIPILLAHEMVGCDEAARDGCEFGIFFSEDATPQDLLRRGIYNSIATPLKGGPWRCASMAMMAGAVARPAEDEVLEPAAKESSLSTWSRRMFRGKHRVSPHTAEVAPDSGTLAQEHRAPPASEIAIDAAPALRSAPASSAASTPAPTPAAVARVCLDTDTPAATAETAMAVVAPPAAAAEVEAGAAAAEVEALGAAASSLMSAPAPNLQQSHAAVSRTRAISRWQRARHLSSQPSGEGLVRLSSLPHREAPRLSISRTSSSMAPYLTARRDPAHTSDTSPVARCEAPSLPVSPSLPAALLRSPRAVDTPFSAGRMASRDENVVAEDSEGSDS